MMERRRLKEWGEVNSLLRNRGSVRVDPVGWLPRSSPVMSNMAFIMVELRVMKYQWTRNMVLSTMMYRSPPGR